MVAGVAEIFSEISDGVLDMLGLLAVLLTLIKFIKGGITMKNLNFIELDHIELSETNGGIGWSGGLGWLFFLQPAYDFMQGSIEGMNDCRSHYGKYPNFAY